MMHTFVQVLTAAPQFALTKAIPYRPTEAHTTGMSSPTVKVRRQDFIVSKYPTIKLLLQLPQLSYPSSALLLQHIQSTGSLFPI